MSKIEIGISTSKTRFGMNVEVTEQVEYLRSLLENKVVRDFGQKDYTNQPEYFKEVLATIPSPSEEELFIELGVFSGATLEYIRKSLPDSVPLYGFDSFSTGLPEDWIGGGYVLQPKGQFVSNASEYLENVLTNTHLVDGLVQNTLENFLKKHNKPIRFIHLDLDLYSSTKYALKTIAQYLVEGSVLVFDDFTNYPSWEEHSFKALAETLELFIDRFELVPFMSAGMNENDPECKGWSSLAFTLRNKKVSPSIQSENFQGEKDVSGSSTGYNNTTVVTGLWDLGREDLDGWSRRSFETYKERFFELLNTDCQMAIWIPSSLKSEVEARRVGKPTRIFIKEVVDFETWNPFYQDIQNIRNREDWRNLATWLPGSPQADLSHYNAMMFTKMFMVNDTAIINPFNSEYFFWIDGGLTSTVPAGYFTHDKVLHNLPNHINNQDGKAVFLTYPYTPHTEVHGFEKDAFAKYCGVDKTDKVARGGFWGGKKDTIHKLNGLYYHYLQETIKSGFMGADENIFTILAYKHPELIESFQVESNGLVWPFFEHLKNITNTKPQHKTGLYVITYNSPAQFETLCKSMEMYDPHLINFTEKYLLNNSTDSSTDEEYSNLCVTYNFTQIRKPENIGICGGRQFIAEHFNNQNHLENYLFFEDDMFFYNGKDNVCRNGFTRNVTNILQTAKGILEKENLDFLKFNFSEFFGDNSLQWAWHNIPQTLREERFPEYTDKPPTTFSEIKSYNNTPYAIGEVFYCNWPQLVSRAGNRKMFLDTTWNAPYEQTWMSYIYQETVKGNIKPGVLLATPTEHDRFDHYPKEDRKEN